MELREYLAVRRAYNLVRQQRESRERLTFAEFAILCRLNMRDAEYTTSQIADYQGALRPTMTHRTKHLADLGLLERIQGDKDRRNVVCRLTEAGREYVEGTCVQVCGVLRNGNILSRTTPSRICRYIDAMGSVRCMSGDLVILGMASTGDGRSTVSELVGMLGLLQPTVSMSLMSLNEEGLVERVEEDNRASRIAPLRLTETGTAWAAELEEAIRALVVRRSHAQHVS